MAMPQFDKPLFKLKVPSTDKEYKFRPFLVKEEKILLLAQESGDISEIVEAIKQIIHNCIQDDKFDVNKLATFDLEYIYLKLRAKSVNNMIEVSYRDLEDEKRYDFKANLDDIEMVINENHSNKIKINENSGIIMKYPQVNIAKENLSTEDAIATMNVLLRNCIDYVYVDDTVYAADEQTIEELNDFIDSLDVNVYLEMQEFLSTMPQLTHELKYQNSLGNERVIVLRGLQDFFSWG